MGRCLRPSDKGSKMVSETGPKSFHFTVCLPPLKTRRCARLSRRPGHPTPTPFAIFLTSLHHLRYLYFLYARASRLFLQRTTSPSRPHLSARVLTALHAEPAILGSGGSRLLVYNRAHAALEARFTRTSRAPPVHLFNSGFYTNAGVLLSGDAAFYDAAIHSSVHDGVRALHVDPAQRRALLIMTHPRCVLRSWRFEVRALRRGKAKVACSLQSRACIVWMALYRPSARCLTPWTRSSPPVTRTGLSMRRTRRGYMGPVVEGWLRCSGWRIVSWRGCIRLARPSRRPVGAMAQYMRVGALLI
jgi:hypothetical protein